MLSIFICILCLGITHGSAQILLRVYSGIVLGRIWEIISYARDEIEVHPMQGKHLNHCAISPVLFNYFMSQKIHWITTIFRLHLIVFIFTNRKLWSTQKFNHFPVFLTATISFSSLVVHSGEEIIHLSWMSVPDLCVIFSPICPQIMYYIKIP